MTHEGDAIGIIDVVAGECALIGLLGREPPPSLGWGDIAFIEAGTGRRRLADVERSILGESSARFPLLG